MDMIAAPALNEPVFYLKDPDSEDGSITVHLSDAGNKCVDIPLVDEISTSTVNTNFPSV